MSDPVQCAVSYPPPPFAVVSVQMDASIPVTLPEAPAPEAETPAALVVDVVFPSSPAVQLTVMPAAGPPGPKGDPGDQGPQGPVGVGLEWVTLTEDAWLALSVKAPDTIYDITDLL